MTDVLQKCLSVIIMEITNTNNHNDTSNNIEYNIEMKKQ